MCQCRDEAKQQQQESEETRDQTEQDADRELLNMRVQHEQIVREQQVQRYHVRISVGLSKWNIYKA